MINRLPTSRPTLERGWLPANNILYSEGEQTTSR
jgi:hypothetical protein